MSDDRAPISLSNVRSCAEPVAHLTGQQVCLLAIREADDWLEAVPLAAAVLRINGTGFALEQCNALFATDNLPHWQANFTAGEKRVPDVYRWITEFALSGRRRTAIELSREEGVFARHFTYTMARIDKDEQGRDRVLLCAIDRTLQRQTEQNLRRELLSDSLTGLPNRAGFDELIEQCRCGEQASRGAVIVLDLRRFGRLNESLGEVTGDELLSTVARRLKSALRQGDVLARLGGNEFGIFVQLKGDNRIEPIVDRLQAALEAPFRLAEWQIGIECAIGCAQSEPDACQCPDLVRRAQAASKVAKQSGRAEYYRPAVLQRSRRRFDLETNLRQAIGTDRFELHYQPLIELRTGQVRGFEGLARWCDPDGGLVSPGIFIPVAEESGLIVPLGRWALDRALATLVDWDSRAGGLLPLSINVNISAVQVARDDIVAAVDAALAAHGIAGHRLTLELTESVLLADPDKAARLMHALRERDVRIAMDDFGTGYSNLANLQRLPVDMLKIDRSLIAPMLVDEDHGAIVKAIVKLAHALGMQTTAEGIETPEIEAALIEAGCSTGQGFFYSKALPEQAAYDFACVRAA